MNANPINHVVILGRDAPLWLSAAVIARALGPSGVSVTALELPSVATPADLMASLPPLEALHRQLRVDERDVLANVAGAFTLGWNFAGVGVPSFLHPFGTFGSMIEGQDFFPHWLKARRYGLNVPLEDFSLAAAAARLGRLFIPDAQSDAYGSSGYGYHLPSLAYAQTLKVLAVRAGVSAHAASAVTALRDGADIRALLLADGRRIDGDFFIDLDGALIGQGANGWESGGAQFPATRMLVAQGPRFTPLPVYAENRAFAQGWVALRPSQRSTHVTAVWSDGVCNDAAIIDALPALCGFPITDVTVRAVVPGLRARIWDGNCVAIGDAACTLDPLHDLRLHNIQLGLVHLLALFPRTSECAAARDEYNRVMRGHFRHLRDFQLLHHTIARYAGPFWDRARSVPLSDDLAHRIDLFQARGTLAPWEEDSLSADSWRCFLVGHGRMPDSHLPMIDTLAPDRVKAGFRQMLAIVKAQVLRQPKHDDYLRRLG